MANTKTKQRENLGSMVGARVPDQVRRFYEKQAQAERRKLSEIIRRVLVENAKAA